MTERTYSRNQNIEVRLINPIEEEVWDQLMKEHHYLGFERLSGEVLKYVVELDGEWVALLGWGSSAFKSKDRDRWIGWRKDQQWKRLKYIANNQRFLILPWIRIKNLASGILGMVAKRISNDWLKRYGHPLLMLETFVEKGRFSGTSYRAAGWKLLGETKGFGRNAKKYYYHGIIKEIYVKELDKRAREILTSDLMLPIWMGGEKVVVSTDSLAITGPDGLIERLGRLKDHRGGQGKKHSKKTVLTISILAGLAGMRSYLGMEDFANALTDEERKILGCKRVKSGDGGYIVPSDTTFARVMQETEGQELDDLIGEWISEHNVSNRIAIDGKTLRGAKLESGKKVHLLSAVAHNSGVVLAQQAVSEKSNEIPAMEPLLDKIDIRDKIITCDALHTQVDTANYIKKRGGDYVFIVKGNQENLRKDIELLEDNDFSP